MQTLVTDDSAAAAALLRAGQTVIFPTETVYGLGANALNPEAVAKIFAAKNRPADNPLIVHIADLAQLDTLVRHVPDYAHTLMARWFPGPLTLLLPKMPAVPDITTGGSPNVGIRMPVLAEARAFLRACGVPVAAPSANITGRPSPTTWQDCVEDMDGRVAAILKGPPAEVGLESTIVDCTGASPVLMRPGGISFEELVAVLPDLRAHAAYGNPNASVAYAVTPLPGMKYRHYAPKARVILVDRAEHLPDVARAGYIGLTPPPYAPAHMLVADSLTVYARSLFAFFRECDRRGLPIIYAERVPEVGLGVALMNRLRKAAAP